MKRKMVTVSKLLLGLGLCFGIVANVSSCNRSDKAKAAAEKTEMVLMIETSSRALMRERIVPMIKEKFPEVNFVSKVRDDAQVEKNVKTAFIAGESIDIVTFWPHQMRVFTEGNMALDLTPYLKNDTAWQGQWMDGALESGNIDGKYVNVPYSTSYPLFQINKEIAEKAGVVIKDRWTWEEFLEACQKIKANTDAFPVGVNSTWGCWFIRNGFMQIWDNETELASFSRGEIPFTDPRVKKVFDNVKALYDNNYMYPGEGALTATNDQILSAFARGKIAILANVNGNAGKAIRETVAGAFEVAVMSWPNMGKPEMYHILGGNEGYFVSANTKNPDKAVEVLKFVTSPEVFQLWADDGKIVPVKGIQSSDPDYALYARDSHAVYPVEVVQFSSEINDYIIYNTPANYVLYGETSLTELEDIRKTVKK
jgi:ABC-type glycerol-3-phosphate transport system substrate-binding protein